MSDILYKVSSVWWNDPETPAQIGAGLLGLLEALEPFDPALANWKLGDEHGYVSLAQARSRMTELVRAGVAVDDENDDAPAPGDGYWVFANCREAGLNRPSGRDLNLRLEAGSKRGNHIHLQAGDVMVPADLSIVTYPIFRGAVEAIAANLPCPSVQASVTDFGDEDEVEMVTPADVARLFDTPYEPPEPDRMVWIAYLSPALAAGVKPPSQLIVERTPGGGLILSATRDRFDLTNPDHRLRGKLLTDIMTDKVWDSRWEPGTMALPTRVGPY